MKKKIILSLVVITGVFAAYLWFAVFNHRLDFEKDSKYLYIKSDSEFNDVIKALNDQGIVPENYWFTELAELRHLPTNIYPGRYTIKNKITWNELIIFLRTGQIDEVTVTFNNVKNIQQLAEQVAKYIEATEDELLSEFTNPETIKELGFNNATFITLFLPNTYRFYWNTSAEQFLTRMKKEYKNFWNEERKGKARQLGLSQSEITTLASIVQSEQSEVEEEWPIIAGLYLNRVRKGMKLQSDPTVIFATGDFTIRRVLNVHLKTNSPYNTYLYAGIPPGPIRIASTKAIDAVLNASKHNYIYMCAKADGKGRHAFTASYAEHLRNAALFQQALNKKKIYR